MCRFARSGVTFQAYVDKVRWEVNRHIKNAGALSPAAQMDQYGRP